MKGVWFRSGAGQEDKRYLYKLEEIGIVIMNKIQKEEFSHYIWVLSNKGREMIKDNKVLEDLWKQKKFKEFYEEVIGFGNSGF